MANSKKIEWQALEHSHYDRNADWYWAVGIISVGIAVLSIYFNNILLAIIILLAAVVGTIKARVKPDILLFEINRKGIVAGETMYPFSSLESFWVIDEDDNSEDKIILKSKRSFVPYIILPFDSTETNPDEIRDYLLDYLDEEELEEPTSQKIMEYFGF